MAITEFLWSVLSSSWSLDISYAIHSKDARTLWDSVHRTPGEVTQEKVDLFMNCIYSHFHRHFKMHLSGIILICVSTSVALALTDGKIQISCHGYLIGVLEYWKELAIFQIEFVLVSYYKVWIIYLFLLIICLIVMLRNYRRNGHLPLYLFSSWSLWSCPEGNQEGSRTRW